MNGEPMHATWYGGDNGWDARTVAGVELVGRTGAQTFTLRYCEEGEADGEPTWWLAIARHGEHWSVDASTEPLEAVLKLCDSLIDGGRCTHCGRPTAVDHDAHGGSRLPPTYDLVCWYRYDPELHTFRRSCEGEAP